MKIRRSTKLLLIFFIIPAWSWIGYSQGMLHYYNKKREALNAQFDRYMDSTNHIMNKNPWRAKVFLDSAKEIDLQLKVIRQKMHDL